MTDAVTLTGAFLAALAFGAGAFLSFVLAPMVFKVLAPAEASGFLRAMFPRYYAFLLACGLGLVGVGLAQPELLPAAVGLAALAAGSLALVPRINTARDAGEAGAARFRRLHGLSVAINLAMLGASGWLVAGYAGS